MAKIVKILVKKLILALLAFFLLTTHCYGISTEINTSITNNLVHNINNSYFCDNNKSSKYQNISLSNRSSIFEISVDNIKKDEIKHINITNENIAIKTIKILVNENVNETSKFIIKSMCEKSKIINITPSNKIYQYIIINNENIDYKPINDILFEFNVNNYWLIENNINKTKIVLFEYNETSNKWHTVLTKLNQSDPTMLTYKANGNRLSEYAIGVKEIINEEKVEKKKIPFKPDANIAIDDDVINENKIILISGSKSNQNQIKNNNNLNLFIAFIIIGTVIIIISSVCFYFYHNMDLHQETFDKLKNKFQKNKTNKDITSTEDFISQSINKNHNFGGNKNTN
jgi:PGF-pre-PGF domain-containing protein